jgi:hypothetical protein
MFRGAAVAIIVGLVTSGALAAQQAATGNDGEEWYKIATGIIAIPAALLGVLISWNMVRKTRLETRKLQLEIDDRERTLVETSKGESDVPLVLAPFSESQKAVLIIISRPSGTYIEDMGFCAISFFKAIHDIWSWTVCHICRWRTKPN